MFSAASVNSFGRNIWFLKHLAISEPGNSCYPGRQSESRAVWPKKRKEKSFYTVSYTDIVQYLPALILSSWILRGKLMRIRSGITMSYLRPT